MFAPCKLCKGSGVTKKEKTEKEIMCDACSGTGSGMIHLNNVFNKQLAATLDIQNKALQEIRKKSYELFSKHKQD